MSGNFLLLLAHDEYFPKNTAAPSLNAEQPYLGQTFSATSGTWEDEETIERRWEVE